MKYKELRKELLIQIKSARKEYFRLKAEIATLSPQLPAGSYIGNYKSNYRYTYHALAHREAVLPSATDDQKLTKKLHLGLDHNPKYRLALLELEQVRLWQIKTDTLSGIKNHLNALKLRWLHLRSLRTSPLDLKTPEGKLLAEFAGAAQNESVFDLVLRQHYSRTLANSPEE